MTAGEIATRQEIRQLLNECGINKNTIGGLVEETLKEEVRKTVERKVNGFNIDKIIDNNFNINSILKEEIKSILREKLYGITVNVEVKSKDNNF